MAKIVRRKNLNNKRSRTFYRQDEIQKGLYTLGSELMTIDGLEYVGAYHIYTATSEIFSESAYDINKSTGLFPFVDVTSDAFTYTNVAIRKPSGVTSAKAPTIFRPTPSLEDFERGYIIRYFLQKRNEINNIIEVDLKQSKKVKLDGTRAINGNLYKLFTIEWKISGPEFDVLDDKGNIITAGVVDTNRRTIFINDSNNPGTANMLGDLREFSIYSKLTDDTIKQQFKI